MDSNLSSIVFLLLFFLAAAILILVQNRCNRKRFLARIKNSWGQVPQKEYTYEELEHIAQFFRQREKDGFYIDDITWNDLDMDRIFILINQSCSPVGTECLYDLLRKPVFEEKELKERQRLIEFFRSHQEERQKLQMLLTSIRKPGNVGIFEAVHVTREVTVQGKTGQVLCFGAFLLSLLFFVLKPNPGVLVFLVVCLVNIGTYWGKKGEIDAYLTSFGCVLQLLEAQKRLEKAGIHQLKEYEEQGKQYKKQLSGFQKGAFWVTERSSTVGGGLEGLFMDYIRMMTHIDLIKFHDMMHSMQDHMTEIEGLISLFGYLDSMISIASFREILPYYSLPQFLSENRARMETEDLYHPLISHPVANSISAQGGILVTGSNASGKSTFLKNVAINAILAQTVYTCTASSYRAPYFKVMTSMALRDDLESGKSYFIVEIRSLKRILDEADRDGNLLCIIDEVLRGTNTIERIAASSEILWSICRRHVLSFAATHDIELSYMLENRYKNYHFEEEVGEDDVVFNYLLKEGRVTTRNAIRLLDMMKYDRKLTQRARRAVEHFEQEGVWENIKDSVDKCR